MVRRRGRRSPGGTFGERTRPTDRRAAHSLSGHMLSAGSPHPHKRRVLHPSSSRGRPQGGCPRKNLSRGHKRRAGNKCAARRTAAHRARTDRNRTWDCHTWSGLRRATNRMSRQLRRRRPAAAKPRQPSREGSNGSFLNLRREGGTISSRCERGCTVTSKVYVASAVRGCLGRLDGRKRGRRHGSLSSQRRAPKKTKTKPPKKGPAAFDGNI